MEESRRHLVDGDLQGHCQPIKLCDDLTRTTKRSQTTRLGGGNLDVPRLRIIRQDLFVAIAGKDVVIGQLAPAVDGGHCMLLVLPFLVCPERPEAFFVECEGQIAPDVSHDCPQLI